MTIRTKHCLTRVCSNGSSHHIFRGGRDHVLRIHQQVKTTGAGRVNKYTKNTANKIKHHLGKTEKIWVIPITRNTRSLL